MTLRCSRQWALASPWKMHQKNWKQLPQTIADMWRKMESIITVWNMGWYKSYKRLLLGAIVFYVWYSHIILIQYNIMCECQAGGKSDAERTNWTITERIHRWYDYGRRSDKSSIAIQGGFIMITKNPMYFHCYLMIAKLVYWRKNLKQFYRLS